MSIKPNLLSLCLLGALLLSSCDKGEPTVIQGVVTDRKTGAPVEEARVWYTYNATVTSSNVSKAVLTDANGAFRIALPANIYSAVLNQVNKSGYYVSFNISGGYDTGNEYFKECHLVPYEGHLKFVITNTGHHADSIYLQAFAEGLLQEHMYRGTLYGDIRSSTVLANPVYVPKDSTVIKTIKTLAGEKAYIYWNHVPFSDFSSPFMDSVYLVSVHLVIKIKHSANYRIFFRDNL